MGTINAQVSEAAEKVKSIEAQCEEQMTKSKTLEDEKEALAAQNAELSEKVASNEDQLQVVNVDDDSVKDTRIGELESEIDSLKARKPSRKSPSWSQQLTRPVKRPRRGAPSKNGQFNSSLTNIRSHLHTRRRGNRQKHTTINTPTPPPHFIRKTTKEVHFFRL